MEGIQIPRYMQPDTKIQIQIQINKYKYRTGCTRARCASRRVGRRAGLLRGLEESPGSLALDQGRGRAKEPFGGLEVDLQQG